ncbi:DNA polymerase III subunit gamma/tau [Andreprevotia chitinilytica]|uniref:DNA polymerase III subunit gamma/tau n=1 Tax=Andreprevotia chitinilytica TaxID=396808 RepID=UPI0005576FF9|nr:DNA polymerase III subunit gamma/tau [Andreprevotia chitinilytica]
MAYQVLARKWRPKTFAQLVGQEHVIKALANAFASERLHHAYLLTGTRGVGKTTIARIMAKALNCETGITAEPCGVCSACTQIDAGRFVDLLEIDAASNTGIDNIREVLDNAQYSPTAGRFKVYIIDEVHMLSKSAFNAMLKTLEEPPGHVKFILATTDPQKVPITVLSRCLQFSLRQMTPQQVSGHLQKVLDAEQITFETSALPLLGHAANGSMRDALSLLDQAIAYGAGQVEEAGVRAMLGAVDQSYLFDILAALIAQDGTALMASVETIAGRGLSYEAALHELAHLLHQIALAQTVPGALADDLPQRANILAVAQSLTPEDTQLYYQIALHGRRDLPLAPDEYAGFTMTLLRMLAFAPASPVQVNLISSPASPGQVNLASAPPAQANPISSSSQPRQASSASVVASPQQVEPSHTPAQPAPSIAAASISQPSVVPSPVVAQPPAAADEPPPPPPWAELEATDTAEPIRDDAPTESHVFVPTPVAPAIPEPTQEVAAPAAPDAEPSHDSAPWHEAPAEPIHREFDGDWRGLLGKVKLGRAGMLAQHAELASFRNDVFELRVAAEHRNTATRDYQDPLCEALSDYFGRPIQVKVVLGDEATDTPAAQTFRERAQRQSEAETEIQNDPFVQTLVRDFGGSIIPDSIKPYDRTPDQTH